MTNYSYRVLYPRAICDSSRRREVGYGAAGGPGVVQVDQLGAGGGQHGAGDQAAHEQDHILS